MRVARQAWRDARVSWMRSEAMWFGPVMDRRSVGLVDWSPIAPERIEAMLVNNPATTDADVRNALASTQRGFGAVEYLLFDHQSLSRLSEPESARCDYLQALGRVIASEAAAILERVDRREEGRSRLPGLSHRAVIKLVAHQCGSRRGSPNPGLSHSKDRRSTAGSRLGSARRRS